MRKKGQRREAAEGHYNNVRLCVFVNKVFRISQISNAIQPHSGLQKTGMHSPQLHSPQFHYGLCNVRPFQGRAAHQTVG